MSELFDYKCPSCGGAIQFDSHSQKMKCPFCSSEINVDALKSQDETLDSEAPDTMDWSIKPGSEWEESEIENMMLYTCRSCGGEIVGDKTLAATSCPFCDNKVVIASQFKGDLKPDFVIPFKLDKRAAKDGYFKHLKGKFFLPKVFKEENHIDEIKGLYVPFWLFDAEVDAAVRYKATTVDTWSDSNYYYTRTNYYSVYRAGSVAFDYVPVDGSTKMDDDLMESVEPYHYNEMIDFKTAYLAGYLADRYDVNANESITRANQRIKRSTEDVFASTVVGYTTVVPVNSSIQLQNGQARYALCPLWLLNTTWNGKRYVFAMNGQTGKFVGNLPMDYKKVVLTFLLIFIVTALGTFSVLQFLKK